MQIRNLILGYVRRAFESKAKYVVKQDVFVYIIPQTKGIARKYRVFQGLERLECIMVAIIFKVEYLIKNT